MRWNDMRWDDIKRTDSSNKRTDSSNGEESVSWCGSGLHMQQMKSIWSYHIWSFYNLARRVDVPTLCQKPSKDHSDMFHHSLYENHEKQEWSEMTWAIWHLARMDHQKCRSYGDPKPFTRSKKYPPGWFRGLPTFSASTSAKHFELEMALCLADCLIQKAWHSPQCLKWIQMMYSKASGGICAVNPIRKPAAPEETAKEA